MAAGSRRPELALVHEARQLELAGVATCGELLAAHALHQAGRPDEAAGEPRRLLPMLEQTLPADLYLPEAWWIAIQAFDAVGAGDEAAMALALALRWIHQVALPQVPESFRESFLQRDPTNRWLLAAASRRPG
jgi:hypothetical protein